MQRQPARAMLIDLDGVVRRWDPDVAASVEAEHSLPAGALADRARSADAGFDCHLTKPVELQALLDIVAGRL